MFSKFGRLAQISLKNAYGFVQYHTVAEGMAAMQNAQGVEMGGRKIRKCCVYLHICTVFDIGRDSDCP